MGNFPPKLLHNLSAQIAIFVVMTLVSQWMERFLLLATNVHFQSTGRAMSTSGVKVTRFSLNARRDSNSIKISALGYFGQCQFT